MAIKPKNKTAAKPAVKSTAKPAAKAKAKAKATPKVPGERKATRHGLLTRLLLERKHTDEHIRSVVNKEFAPQVLHSVAPSVARAYLNKALSKDQQIERLFLVDGKLIPKSKKPKTVKGKRPPIDPKNDPLSKVAGIVVKKKAAKPKA